MGKSSEDQLSSDGELQGQPVEATAAKISMGKLFLLIGTIVTPQLSLTRLLFLSLGQIYAIMSDNMMVLFALLLS